MTRPLPFDAWYIFHNPSFVRLILITWWEEIAVQNVNFGKFIFILRTLNKTVIRILTQNDVNFKRKLFHRKVATAENTDQVAQVHRSLVRNYTACPAMFFFYKKTALPKGTWIYTLTGVSPLFENQGRMHKQWGLISHYINEMFPDNFEKNVTKMLLIKSICPMWVHPWLKKIWVSPKRNAAKGYIMCTFKDVKPTQETAGSGLNRLYNVLCSLWNIHSGAPLPPNIP